MFLIKQLIITNCFNKLILSFSFLYKITITMISEWTICTVTLFTIKIKVFYVIRNFHLKTPLFKLSYESF